MLTASPSPLRIASRVCAISGLRLLRLYSGSRNASNISKNRGPITRNPGGNGARSNSQRAREEEATASLYEQLFGASSVEAEHDKVDRQEVPRIPLESPDVHQSPDPLQYDEPMTNDSYRRGTEKETAEGPPQVSVLVLRSASKHLTEADFKRLIPQGSHLEGWTLEQGDILKVIPGRDPVTLEQSNYYYLLFSSRLSAFTYQGHALGVHRLVASHTPSSILSPMMPPPGIMAKNIDVHAAIQSFSLVAPNQPIDLRQLKPPLTLGMEAIVRHRGHPFLASRRNQMPYEARLTLEGPQVHEEAIRHFFIMDGMQRGLSWSGNERRSPTVTLWRPPKMGLRNGLLSPMKKASEPEAMRWAARQRAAEEQEALWDAQANETDISREFATQFDFDDGPDGKKTEETEHGWSMKPLDTFVIGFATESAMQSFVHYWHRRPMRTEGFEQEQGARSDSPPIINVEALW